MLLAKSGWDVDVTGRDPSRMPKKLSESGVSFHQLERNDIPGVERLVGNGADLMIDLVAYSAPAVRAAPSCHGLNG